MNPSEAEFWQAGVRQRPKDMSCPKLVWAYIHAANRRGEPWQVNRDEWARKLLRIMARSPTIFPSRNPDLKSSLKELDLEWLKPGQIVEYVNARPHVVRFPVIVLIGSSIAT
jgi:hypothetical protein